MKPTQQQIAAAVTRLTILSMFPNNPAAHSEVMRLLARMVPTVEALDWLIDTMIDRVGEWRGTVELRGILCTHYKPLDGIEAYSTIGGFTPSDSESQSLSEHEERTRADLAARRVTKRLK